MTRYLTIDDAAMRGLELHETRAHAIPGRNVLDLGHAFVLHDPRDVDVFWNRMVSVRWPGVSAGFDRRFTEALALFASLGRRPHIWPSPVGSAPLDLVDRLVAHGFRDIGGGHLMLLGDPGSCPPVRPTELGQGVTLQAIRSPADAGPGDLEDMALVLAESFAAQPGRAAELAVELRATVDDPRTAMILVRVDDEPAAAAKAITFDGLTYLSSIGTRAGHRGRGLAALATRHAITVAGGRVAGRTYLGVFSGNAPALRLYQRLGFASLGESPDLVLE